MIFTPKQSQVINTSILKGVLYRFNIKRYNVNNMRFQSKQCLNEKANMIYSQNYTITLGNFSQTAIVQVFRADQGYPKL
jgi:hypothetical protein